MIPLKMKIDNKKYLDITKILSYNAYYNIITGARGLGKTTQMILYALNYYNKTGIPFTIIRRYKPELKKFINKRTLDNTIDGVIRYKGDGGGGYIVEYEGQVFCYLLLLSVSVGDKSTSIKSDIIIFDEYSLKRRGAYRYLSDETELFLNLIGTIERTRTSTKLFLLGNNDDLFSPYFEYFNIPYFEDKYYDKERNILCCNVKPSELLLKEEENTGLYKLTKGTRFHEYYYENKFIKNNAENIIDKPLGAMFYFRIGINDKTINVYRFDNDKLYCEIRNKVIEDNFYYPIIKHGNLNYYYGKILRNKLGPLLLKSYADNKVFYNNELSSNYFISCIDIIK